MNLYSTTFCGMTEQHNVTVGGDNISIDNHGNNNITIIQHNGIVGKLVKTIESQQRTIEILVSMLKHD